MGWTTEQQAVIDSRGGDLLVSAAAGSGKTAVLVERILTMISDDEQPMDIDTMLIVTFTKAAAAEMKERIAKAIDKKLQQDPENVHLRKQVAYVQKAQISTIHSFCLQLIRDHFNVLGIDPEFRMLDEGEKKLLRIDVTKQVLEQFYEEGSQSFHLLVEGYTSGKDDKALEEFMERLYELAMSNPDPEEWLLRAKKRFCIHNEDELFQCDGIQDLLESTRQLIHELIEKNELALSLTQKPGGPLAYEKTLLLDKAYLQSLVGLKHYNAYKLVLEEGGFSRLSGRTSSDVDEELKQMVKQLREEIKDQLTSWKEQFFSKSAEEMLSEIALVKEPMEALIDLVLAFRDQFAKAKEKKNVLDFSDLEHYALELLVDQYEEGRIVPSPIAKELRNSYKEIFIDEYQDSNLIQEAILSSISGEEEGQQNRFMVGDVKQSIYRFRLARPELFMEKYDRYGKGNEQEKKIELHKNFRSRSSVLESTNYIFRQLMGRDLGGVEYDYDAKLVPGKQFPMREMGQSLGEEEDKTELLIIEADESDFTKKELEAYAIARKIQELMNEQQPYYIYDESQNDGKGGYRPVGYKDIVILLRTVSGWSEILEDVLLREGIPAHGDSQKGYFSAMEVQHMIQLLTIVDNRYQDIPMTAVLRSPMVGLKGEDLAWIKAIYGTWQGKEQTMYDSLSLFAEEEFHETQEELLLGKSLDECIKLQQRIVKFLQMLERLEYQKTCLSIHDLIWEAFNQTGYFHYVTAMPQGKKRQANLLMLIEKANQYERTSYKGLFHFIRYINQLREYEVDFGEANVLGEGEDVVRIMSIHKSKGLEFPVVFVGELSKPFNFMDLRQKILIHAEDYLGPDAMDIQTRQAGATWIKQLMQKKLKEETLAEELRVLYVAMTRAKEKLILIGTIDDYHKKYNQFSYVRYQLQGVEEEHMRLSLSIRTKATCYLDWFLSALMLPQDWIEVEVIEESKLVVQAVEKQVLLEEKKEQLLNLKTSGETPEQVEWIKEQFEWQYPFEKEVKEKGKYSVSELKKRGQLEEGEEYFKVTQEGEEIEQIRPRFMQEEKKEETGASRGTVVHKVMELFDFEYAKELEQLKQQLDRMEEQQYITKEQRQEIPILGIQSLIQSPLGQRLIKAQQEENLYKESQYMMGVQASEINPAIQSEEMILIQGVIDVWFEENDGLVLVDYKTDKVTKKEELIKRYSKQMELYKKALEQMTGKVVKETYIYSFSQKETICIFQQDSL